MAKTKNKGKNKNKAKNAQIETSTPQPPTNAPITLSDLRKDNSLWYRILLLIHDFHHQKQPPSKTRTDEILDIIYIGAPYFTSEEADKIKSAIVEDSQKTLEELIHARLEDRRATTLSAIFPCGPHDMVPVYLECFGVDKAEILDKKFLERVERWGLKS